ncbi:hypothetical protein H310_13755 [Aphanomyces invadans]|uniref:N-acetyltransferase domain-containing protein n=1 Tax=Aphanomyces invadans TaxID=157072 RepID=A0A024TC98_9STRA|nr:hypothetical protein H310_13755 [Aphanomyces invadans]ETV91678.1 hypothetical protein H310_13755 [Aphanomyces invadans]|eukprot:XP_008879604.1 hypothetical protein H310_13755 [Aphanomyces invadans]
MGSRDRDALPVEFGPITAQNVGVLRVLNQVIFPVRYNDAFYTDIVSTPRELSKYGCVNGMIVSSICCRVETMPDGFERVYIMTLGVLEPYRKHSLGGALLESVLAHCERMKMDHIYLHVQTSNAAAIRFYERHGFHVTQTIYNYYRNISPPDCFILARSFG